MSKKIIDYYPILIAILMYGVATYLIIFVYVSYDYQPSALSNWTTLFSVFGTVASFLYLSGSILVIGYFISSRIRKP